MRITYRPLPTVWPFGERTAYPRWSRFKANWQNTLELLQRELNFLDAGDLVIESGFRAEDIRLDGFPRRHARPVDPAVILSFPSKFGPLRYGTDQFTDHESNIRAIALAREALRAVDRYGVTRRGEQYQGWLGLPTADEPMTAEDAMLFLRRYAGLAGDADVRTLYRRAAKRLHPDMGGDPGEFKRLDRVAKVLGL